jgi:hypothetical protein
MALPPEIFCDTSFFNACLDPEDFRRLGLTVITVPR